MTLQQVTRDEFYARVGPMNVHPRPERDATYWETPNRELIGKSTPGYMCNGPTAYFLAKAEQPARPGLLLAAALAAALAASLPLGASAEGGAPAPAAPGIPAPGIDHLDFWLNRLRCREREPQDLRMACYAGAGRMARVGAEMLARQRGRDI